MTVKFPGEKAVEADRFQIEPFLGDIMQSGLTGYSKFFAGDLGGLVVFDKGDITAAYFTEKGQIVSSGVDALLSLQNICEDEPYEFSVAEVPKEYISLIATLHLGSQVIPETDTNILNLQNLFQSYRGRIENGLLVIHSIGGDVELIAINQGNWHYATSEDRFLELFAKEGSRLSLYEKPKLPKTSRDADELAKYRSAKVGKRKDAAKAGERIKEIFMTNFRGRFGPMVESIVEEFSHKDFNANNYQEELKKGFEYLKLFIDEKEAKPFVEMLEVKIKKIIEEETR
jgi:hypothetical protein